MQRRLASLALVLIAVVLLGPSSPAMAIPDLIVGIEGGTYYYEPGEPIDSHINFITDSFAEGSEDLQGWVLTEPGYVTVYSWGSHQGDLAGFDVYFAATDLTPGDGSGWVEVDGSAPDRIQPEDEPHPDGYHGSHEFWNLGDPSTWDVSLDPDGNPLGTEITVFVDFTGFQFDFWAFADNINPDGIFTEDGGGGTGNEPFSPRSHNTGTPPIPEPATLLLFGVGLAGLAGLRKKYSG